MGLDGAAICNLPPATRPRHDLIGVEGATLPPLSGRNPASVTMEATGPVHTRGRSNRIVQRCVHPVRIWDCRE
jgi:hypothetical protein